MNAWKTADAVVRRLEAAIPVYDVGIAAGVRAYGGGLQPPEDPDAEPRVRADVGGWDR